MSVLGKFLNTNAAASSSDDRATNTLSTMLINDPTTLASLETAFDAYEIALTTNDVPALDTLFWESPHTLRYGATENLQGYEAIREFRAARPGSALQRTIIDRSVTTFGTDFGVANITFHRNGESRIGRQSQTWARVDGKWQVVAAHVSWMDESRPRA